MSTYELHVRSAEPSVPVVTLTGELDLTNAREIERRLEDAARGAARLVVDLNAVLFIDSAALHVFFKLARTLGDGGLTVVADADAPVTRTLEIVGVPDAMRVVDSVNDVLAP